MPGILPSQRNFEGKSFLSLRRLSLFVYFFIYLFFFLYESLKLHFGMAGVLAGWIHKLPNRWLVIAFKVCTVRQTHREVPQFRKLGKFGKCVRIQSKERENEASPIP